MKLRNFRNKIAGAVFTFSLLLGVAVAANVTANAQYQNDPYRRQQDDQYRRQQDRDQRRRDRDTRDNDNRRRGRNDDGYGNYGGSFQLRQTALNAGANEGVKAGREDRKRGRSYDFQSKSAFQKATKDYSSKLGDRETYRQYYREAFSHGYADGYSGH
jgi:hypothetical protein